MNGESSRIVRAAIAASAAAARRTHVEQVKTAVRAHIEQTQRRRRELSDVLAVLRFRTADFRTRVRQRLRELARHDGGDRGEGG